MQLCKCKGVDFNVKPYGVICWFTCIFIWNHPQNITCQSERCLQCSQTQGCDFADSRSLSKAAERKQQGCDKIIVIINFRDQKCFLPNTLASHKVYRKENHGERYRRETNYKGFKPAPGNGVKDLRVKASPNGPPIQIQKHWL